MKRVTIAKFALGCTLQECQPFFIFINIRPRIDLSRQQGEVIKDEIKEEELYPIIARSIAFFAKLERAQRGEQARRKQ